jgi:hypothetical protein
VGATVPAEGQLSRLVPQLGSPAEMTDSAALAGLPGPVRSVSRRPLPTVGYTEARHELLTVTLGTGPERRLVLKRVRLSADWTACRTSDRIGREAALLAEPALADIWQAFACPYRSFATAKDEIALWMDDLSPTRACWTRGAPSGTSRGPFSTETPKSRISPSCRTAGWPSWTGLWWEPVRPRWIWAGTSPSTRLAWHGRRRRRSRGTAPSLPSDSGARAEWAWWVDRLEAAV